MIRRTLAPLALALLALAACPKDKKEVRDTTASIPLDTMPTDLSQVTSNIPEAAPDTFRKRTPVADPAAGGTRTASIPEAPSALLAAVQREVSFQRFCYQEFGQKADPSLAGNVAMIVTVSSSGISGAEVGNSRWTSSTGRAVNTCLSQKAKQAWKLEPGAVKPGRYVVQLSFRGT